MPDPFADRLGFVPGRQVNPLGQLDLEVVFGEEENFRSETLWFELTLFHTGYNAIFGRLAYVKFMTLPSYAYLQLKMSGPNRTITIHGSPERALEAEVTNMELADAALASAELEEIKKAVDPAATMLPSSQDRGQLSGRQKKQRNSRWVILGGDLPEEQEAALLQFLRAKCTSTLSSLCCSNNMVHILGVIPAQGLFSVNVLIFP